MEMAFNAGRVSDLTGQLNVAIIERINEIATERVINYKELI